jgi:hypothetical protein
MGGGYDAMGAVVKAGTAEDDQSGRVIGGNNVRQNSPPV